MKNTIIMTGVFLLLPIITFAQLGEVDTFFNNVMTFINNVLIPFVFALALLIFIWGMFRFFILGGDNEDERAKGKQLILWAVIGFVLMTSIWGIVNMVAGGFFPGGADKPKLPTTLTK